MKKLEYDPLINLLPALKSKNSNNYSDNLKKSLSGLEKESIRLDENNNISKTSHNYFFGSSLCNSFFTTDFAESQIEFVTPPNDTESTLEFLKSSHHFAYRLLKNEYLWPLSMPPVFDESELAIASFGTSNQAKFKEVYRKGLSIKYGKMIQAISGVHFNYSFNEEFLLDLSKYMRVDYSKDFRSYIYFRTIRNFQRINWLLLFLLGASPFFSKKHDTKHESYDSKKDYLFLPYATSFRMSDIGYQNSEQSNLHVLMNDLEEYVDNIRQITQSKIYQYNKNDPDENIEPAILNGKLLIEDEHYGVIRPKSSSSQMRRNSHNLQKNGIDYLEIRSVDIDPFSLIGVDLSSLEFIKAIILYCALSPSPVNDLESIRENKLNEKKVSVSGRKPELKLTKDGTEVSMMSWATSIIDQIKVLYDILGYDFKEIEKYEGMINNPDKTPSSMILKEILESNLTLNDFGREIGMKSKSYFLSQKIDENKNWKLFELEKIKSTQRQAQIESKKSLDFFSFMDSYYEGK